MTCLIIGAGMAGLTAANLLQNAGWVVTVVDKSRGVGGRMATRRLGASRFDHGAQFFTVRDAGFQATTDDWMAKGWVQPWYSEGGHPRYRATGGMNALAKELATGLADVRLGVVVEHIEFDGAHWQVIPKEGERLSADCLILTPPAPQTFALAGSVLPAEISDALKAITFDPCFSLMLELDGPGGVPGPGYIRPDEGPIAWIADNVQKGISPGPKGAITVHARPDFSREHLEQEAAIVTQLLVNAARPWLNGAEVLESQLHRWRYSQPVSPNPAPCLFAETPAPVAIAGDAFGGPRVEGAYLSGVAAAERSLRR